MTKARPIADAAPIFRRLDREIWLLTSSEGPRRGGLIVTSVAPASIVPELPRVLVGLGKTHLTWELVETSGAFVLHLLTDAQADWVWRFGLRSGRDVDKLQGLAVEAAASGAPRLVDAARWLDCRVEARLDAGDRTVVLAEVIAARDDPSATILTVHRLVAEAPEPRRRELREQLERDAALDAPAIEAWRRSHRPQRPGNA
jgi:flavin reductase (DIM6/NTAB) family NADH-FMN oxidoreductase RutF